MLTIITITTILCTVLALGSLFIERTGITDVDAYVDRPAVAGDVALVAVTGALMAALVFATAFLLALQVVSLFLA